MKFLLKLWRMFRAHPLTRDAVGAAFWRVARWRLAAMLGFQMVVPWVGQSVLLLERGRNGAVHNWYLGLIEYEDMAFVMHFLRPEDLFLDGGANIGAFTVLGAGVAGAETISVEPHPEAHAILTRNVGLNALGERVSIRKVGLADTDGTAHLTFGLETSNRIVETGGEGTIEIPITTIDAVLDGRCPACIKLDIEGAEPAALDGAPATLANPLLKAVIVELNDRTEGAPAFVHVDSVLRAAGFEPRYYDPARRAVIPPPETGKRNWIYMRDLDAIEARLRDAPAFEVLGQKI